MASALTAFPPVGRGVERSGRWVTRRMSGKLRLSEAGFRHPDRAERHDGKAIRHRPYSQAHNHVRRISPGASCDQPGSVADLFALVGLGFFNREPSGTNGTCLLSGPGCHTVVRETI